MKHYLQVLERVKALHPVALLPGHGELIDDPDRAIDWIIEHRLQREANIVAALRANPDLTPSELVPHVYQDVPQRLFGLAARSLLAHLLKLEEDGVASNTDSRWHI